LELRAKKANLALCTTAHAT